MFSFKLSGMTVLLTAAFVAACSPGTEPGAAFGNAGAASAPSDNSRTDIAAAASTAPRAGGETHDAFYERLESAMADPLRPPDDRALDATRKPIGVLRFFGIMPGMSVLDVNAAGGYYTELLAAAVGPAGTVYAQNDPAALAQDEGALEQQLDARLSEGRLPNVRRMDRDLSQLDATKEFDAALLVLTLHDLYNSFGEETTIDLLHRIRSALKPGGILGVVDHVGEASRSVDALALHRMEKSVAEDLLQKAGFTIQAESDLLANRNDDHQSSVFDESIRRRTDRFVILALRPEAANGG